MKCSVTFSIFERIIKNALMTYREYNKAVDKYADSLFAFIFKLCKNKQDAEDIVQESFKRLWNKRKDIPPQKVKSFLFTVAYHLFIDLKRKIKRETENSGYLLLKSHSYYMKQPDLDDIIQKALERLPEKQKTVLMLRDYEGYSYKEIAEITGLNEGQVKVYIFRARKAIRNFIGKLENVM